MRKCVFWSLPLEVANVLAHLYCKICFKSLCICFRGTKYETFRERGDEEETNCVGQLNKLFCFDLSSLLPSLALTCDEQYLFVGDGNGSCIHLCQVRGRLKLRTISNIPGLMGTAVTEGGTVFLSSDKEHALFSLKEEEMLASTETLTKVCGETAGHRDGVQSRWNKPTALRVHRNTVFVCDTGNKAVRMLTSAKGTDSPAK